MSKYLEALGLTMLAAFALSAVAATAASAEEKVFHSHNELTDLPGTDVEGRETSFTIPGSRRSRGIALVTEFPP